MQDNAVLHNSTFRRTPPQTDRASNLVSKTTRRTAGLHSVSLRAWCLYTPFVLGGFDTLHAKNTRYPRTSPIAKSGLVTNWDTRVFFSGFSSSFVMSTPCFRPFLFAFVSCPNTLPAQFRSETTPTGSRPPSRPAELLGLNISGTKGRRGIRGQVAQAGTRSNRCFSRSLDASRSCHSSGDVTLDQRWPAASRTTRLAAGGCVNCPCPLRYPQKRRLADHTRRGTPATAGCRWPRRAALPGSGKSIFSSRIRRLQSRRRPV